MTFFVVISCVMACDRWLYLALAIYLHSTCFSRVHDNNRAPVREALVRVLELALVHCSPHTCFFVSLDNFLVVVLTIVMQIRLFKCICFLEKLFFDVIPLDNAWEVFFPNLLAR